MKRIGCVCVCVEWINLAKDAGACEYGNELSDSIKCGKFLD